MYQHRVAQQMDLHNKEITKSGNGRDSGALFSSVQPRATATTLMGKQKTGSVNFTGKGLLLVEDVPTIRQIIKSYLRGTGIEIYEAENGAIALQKFRSSPQRYNVILMDIQMPEMNGYEATAKIRQLSTAHATSVPIIAMTASNLQQDINKCLDIGMNDYLAKPLKIIELKDKLAKHLFVVGGAPLATGIAAKGAGRQKACINWQKAMEMTDNNEQLYLQLLRDFQAQKLYDSLRHHLTQGNSPMIWASAYALKGVAASLAFETLHETIVSIEQLSKEERPASHMLKQLEDAYENTMAERQQLLADNILR